MTINELSKELGITNRVLIDYLKSKNYKVSSHMQSATSEMIEAAKNIKEESKKSEEKPVEEKKSKKVSPAVRSKKKFLPDDMILCRSIVPWTQVEIGIDRQTVYRWSGFGATEYVSYKDLQGMRSKDIIRQSCIMIEDPDICEQWSADLGETYKKFLGVEYVEEFFDLSDEEFRNTLSTAPDTFKEVIKFTAMDMVRNENYPTVQKVAIIDELLGTCIKDFL